MAKAATDQFANFFVISVTESAANTLTFKKLETGISLFEKVAWILHRVEYLVPDDATYFNGTGDNLSFGLSTTDQLTTAAITNAAIVDWNQIKRTDWGTAASMWLDRQPYVRDFMDLPGGGLILPPNPVYAWLKGSGLASAADLTVRGYYTNLQLTPDQYWELVESRRVISNS